jgi:hypothetical protein
METAGGKCFRVLTMQWRSSAYGQSHTDRHYRHRHAVITRVARVQRHPRSMTWRWRAQQYDCVAIAASARPHLGPGEAPRGGLGDLGKILAAPAFVAPRVRNHPRRHLRDGR